ncbi:hypothetical protein FSW04_17715 [Baekduia soli]|uniref:Uncharacterized protein n=1 Tax=Baekduia soli TaxID=496014 RepID=A0A5B8U8F5_9ACTN|nr:hypothetical protein [Baekduia soli]QEC49235.1 hypothetical protein FSW04_17715 [Baekduia soli]
MSTDPPPLTLAQAVHRAAQAVDPDGADADVAELLLRFEDRDEPIASVVDVEEQMAEAVRSLDVDGENPALTLAGAVVTYLAFRRDEADEDPQRLLHLAADAEFDGRPPPAVAAFLAGDS